MKQEAKKLAVELIDSNYREDKRRYISRYGKLVCFAKNLSNGIDFGFVSFKLPIHIVSLHLGPYLEVECMNKKPS